MTVRFSDREITELINEEKPLPNNFQTRLQLRERRGHKGAELEVTGQNGNHFRLIIRQSVYNSLDFSIILAVLPRNTNQCFHLLRLNGKSHEHTNKIERNKFYDFHIHRATERYQMLGYREDTYAEVTKAFHDLQSALEYIFEIANFKRPSSPQLSLFNGGEP